MNKAICILSVIVFIISVYFGVRRAISQQSALAPAFNQSSVDSPSPAEEPSPVKAIPLEVQEAVNLLLKGHKQPLTPDVQKAVSLIHEFEKYETAHYELSMEIETRRTYSDYCRRFPTLKIDLCYMDDQFTGTSHIVQPESKPAGVDVNVVK